MLVKIATEEESIGNIHIKLQIGGKNCIIDKEDGNRICHYTWKLRKVRTQYYACRKVVTNGREFLVFMHRQITRCPNHLVVHHQNRCGLDNRKCNLQLMTPQEHHLLHKFG